jgi:hypothetical protein
MCFAFRLTVVLAIASLLVAACGAATPTVQPSPTPDLSAPPTPPSPTGEIPSGTPGPTGPTTTETSVPRDDGDGVDLDPVDWVLGVNGHARVVTSDLRVRSRPGVSSDSKKLEPLLDEGVLLFVLDGPKFRSGFEWYLVLPIGPIDGPELPMGWVAVTGKDGVAWVRPTFEECPAPPTDVRALARILETDRAYVRIPCFFNEAFIFTARLGTPEATCGTALPWGTDPAWLDSCRQDPGFLVPTVLGPDAPIVYPAFEPGVDLGFRGPPEASWEELPVVEVTGQFDHEAAQECRSRRNEEATAIPEPDPHLVVLECRVQFVVTAIDPTG